MSLLQLKEDREAEKFYKAETKKMLDAVKETENYKISDTGAKTHADSAAKLYERLTRIAVKVFKFNGNKKHFPGIEVKMFTQSMILNRDEMLKFALANPIFLKIDEAGIVKYAEDNVTIDENGKMISPLSFIHLWKEPKATVATDLEKALKDYLK